MAPQRRVRPQLFVLAASLNQFLRNRLHNHSKRLPAPLRVVALRDRRIKGIDVDVDNPTPDQANRLWNRKRTSSSSAHPCYVVPATLECKLRRVPTDPDILPLSPVELSKCERRDPTDRSATTADEP